MRLELQILIAAAADLALGDPRWLPHPVRALGWLAARLEWLTRRIVVHQRTAGMVTAMIVYAAAGGAAWGAIDLAGWLHPLIADAVSIAVIYATIAARDLAVHSLAVSNALARGDLPEARRRVGQIVGRDTGGLDEPEIVRAAVESVAESTVDGVTAPLFYALLAGPAGAMVYRAINTLDSMFGHRDERYARFGWAAARIDDLANYVPARLTAPLVCTAAGLLAGHPLKAMAVLRRDGRSHASPNAGLTEAAMAGALGVQLGGLNHYDGQPHPRPTIGDADMPLVPRHITAANALMFASAGLFLAAGILVRLGTMRLLCAWRIWP